MHYSKYLDYLITFIKLIKNILILFPKDNISSAIYRNKQLCNFPKANISSEICCNKQFCNVAIIYFEE